MLQEGFEFALSRGIIDMAEIQNKVEIMQRKEILAQHPYTISYNTQKKFYYTYFPDSSKTAKGRKQALRMVKRKDKMALENYIIDYWKKVTKKSFNEVYYMWRETKDELVSNNTIAKYQTDYNRFFKGSGFIEMDIDEINDDDIRVFVCKNIRQHHLYKEPMRTLVNYIKNVFAFAMKRKLITTNPSLYIEVREFNHYCYERYKKPKEMTIQDDDMRLLRERFRQDHEKHPEYIPTYAVELASLTGMRVGEIAALRWDRIDEDCITIDQSEKSDRITSEFYIDKTKNGHTRFFPLTDEIRQLLSAIEKVEKEYGYYCEWVFANEDGRIHAPKISSCAKNKCLQLGINPRGKGIHGYRKTFNSNLRDKGLSSAAAAAIMGHTAQVNDTYYYFDRTNEKMKAQVIKEINKETVSV